jgi:CheY-like chemotaxis protein
MLDLDLNHSNTASDTISILVVDDGYDDIISLIKQSLEADGFKVFSFTNSVAALEPSITT